MKRIQYHVGGHISQRERGAVLIVGLVMLLLMTIVGLAAIRGSGMQEMMAGNMRDRNLAFQAAEAGLRAGEVAVDGGVTFSFNGADGSFPDLLAPGSSEVPPFKWAQSKWESLAVATSMTLAGVSEAPRYVVEDVTSETCSSPDYQVCLEADPVSFYRITSRGTGGTSNSEVILQSIIKP